jgi:hypothetical protein
MPQAVPIPQGATIGNAQPQAVPIPEGATVGGDPVSTATQPQENGFVHALKQAFFLEPPDKSEVDAESVNLGVPFNPQTQTLYDPAKHSGLVRGGEKGLTETLSGTSQLLGKAADKLGLRDQSSQGTGILGEAPASSTETEAQGASETTGKVIENVLEFMAGDEALKGLSLGQKLKKFSTVAKFLEDNPFLAKLLDSKLLGSAASNAIVGGTQNAAHGGNFTSGAAVAGAAGAASDLIGGGLSKLAENLKSSAASNATTQAADEFGVPLSLAQKTNGPVSQVTESVLKKTPLVNAPFSKLAGAQNAAIKQAANEIADNIASSAGSDTAAGESIQDAISGAKNTAGKAYDTAQLQIANSGAARLPVPINGQIADTAKRLLEDIELPEDFNVGVKDVQGRQSAVNVLKNLAQTTDDVGNPRSLTWEQARRLKSALRDMATSGESNVGRGALKQMTAAIDGAMQKALVDSGNDALFQQFRAASDNYRMVNDAMDSSFIKRLMNKDPIEVGKYLLDNSTPNAVQTLKSVAGSQMPQVQRGIWEELFDRALTNPDGAVAGKVLQKEFNKMGMETAKAVWSPEQLSKIQRFVNLAAKVGLDGGKNGSLKMFAYGGAGAATGEGLANPEVVSHLKGLLLHGGAIAGGIILPARALANFMTKPGAVDTMSKILSAPGKVRSSALAALVNYAALQHVSQIYQQPQ